MSGGGNPCWRGSPPPPHFFLGVAIGLELGCNICFDWPSLQWEVFPNIICLRTCSFSPFRLFFHCADVLSTRVPSSEVMHPWSSLLLPPFLHKGRMGVDGLGMPLCCFPRVFLSSCSTLVEREGWRILWSRVCCTDARFCLLGSFVDGGFRSCSLAADSCYLFCPGWLSSSTLHARRGVGEGESSGGVLCSRLPLPPHLCTLGDRV